MKKKFRPVNWDILNSKFNKIKTSAKVLTHKDLASMNDDQLKDYVYAQLEDWPTPLTQCEKEMLYGSMLCSVAKMRDMSMDERERASYLRHRKENREKIEAYNEELKKPKLQEMVIEV